jgi:hypothetical protein
MANRITIPFYIDQTTIGMVWLSKTKIFLIEETIGAENGWTYHYVPWLSTDGGKSFNRLQTRYAEGVVTGDGSLYRRNTGPNLWVDAQQNIHMMAMDFGGTGNNVYFFWQKLDGDNWQAVDGNRVANRNGAIPDTTHFFWDGDGKMFQAFMRNAGDNGDVIIYEHPGFNKASRVDANWIKYNLPQTVAGGGQRSQRAMYAAPVNGRAMIFYGWADITNGSLYLKVLKHNGSSWSSVGTTATFAKGIGGRFMDIISGAVRDDGTVVLAMADYMGETVRYAIYDTISNTWLDLDSTTTGAQNVVELYRNPQINSGNIPAGYGIGGPYVYTDGQRTIIAYITRSAPTTGTKVWTVRSRRLLADNTLEAEKTYESYNDHQHMQTFDQQPASQGPGGGRVMGPRQSQSRIFDRAAILYPHTDFAQGMHQLQTIDNNKPSLQPTPTSLIGAQITSSLNPTATWDFNDDNLDDAQTAFDVEIRRQDTGAVIYSSGKQTSAVGSYTFPNAAGLAYNKFYQWRVRTYDTADVAGAWSDLQLFKTTQAPTGTFTQPLNGGTLPSDTPTFMWTYNQTAGVAQTHYRVHIFTYAGGTNKEIYTGQWVATANGFADIPSGILENGGQYFTYVDLRSAEGAEGVTNTVYFDVQFIAPPTPQIDVQQNRLEAFNTIRITQTVPFNNSLSADTMRVYRAESGSDDGYQLLRDNIAIPVRVIDNFEDPAKWVPTTGTPALTQSTNAQQGTYSLNLGSAATKTVAQWDYNNYPVNGPNSADYSNYDKIHVWVYLAAGTKEKIQLLRFRFGLDSNNYYQYDHDISYMTNGAWNLLNIPFNTARIFGTPSLSKLAYVSFDILVASAYVATGIPVGDVKLDQMRLLKDNYEVYDYAVGNDKSYTYRVVTVNSENNLESRPAISDALTTVFPDQMPDLRNTYLTPIGAETTQVAAWHDSADAANWQRNTETEYYKPLNRKRPIVYKNGFEDYRQGSITLMFWDSSLVKDSSTVNGIRGAKQLEQILASQTLLMRTWWGDVIQVSIDGKLSIQRAKGKAWVVSFSWTEVGD